MPDRDGRCESGALSCETQLSWVMILPLSWVSQEHARRSLPSRCLTGCSPMDAGIRIGEKRRRQEGGGKGGLLGGILGKRLSDAEATHLLQADRICRLASRGADERSIPQPRPSLADRGDTTGHTKRERRRTTRERTKTFCGWFPMRFQRRINAKLLEFQGFCPFLLTIHPPTHAL